MEDKPKQSPTNKELFLEELNTLLGRYSVILGTTIVKREDGSYVPQITVLDEPKKQTILETPKK